MPYGVYQESDQALFDAVAALQSGQAADTNQVYQHSNRYLYSLILEAVKNPVVTDWILKDVYVELYNQLGTLADPMTFYSWAGRIATGQTLAYLLRNRNEVPPVPAEEGATYFPYDQALMDGEKFIPAYVMSDPGTQAQIESAIAELSPIHKIALQYYYYEGYSVFDVAKAMGASEAETRGRLFQAKQALKRLFANAPAEEDLYSLSEIPLFWLSLREKAEHLN